MGGTINRKELTGSAILRVPCDAQEFVLEYLEDALQGAPVRTPILSKTSLASVI